MLGHLSKHFGKPDPNCLQEIVPTGTPVTIHVFRDEEQQELILMTDGLSARPMEVPRGKEEFRYAEICQSCCADSTNNGLGVACESIA